MVTNELVPKELRSKLIAGTSLLGWILHCCLYLLFSTHFRSSNKNGKESQQLSQISPENYWLKYLYIKSLIIIKGLE